MTEPIVEAIADMCRQLKDYAETNAALGKELAEARGREKMLIEINNKLQATIITRETSLAAYQLGDKINALDPMPRPAPPEPQRLAPQQIAGPKIMPDQLEAMIEAERDPMPAFIRNAKQVGAAKVRSVA